MPRIFLPNSLIGSLAGLALAALLCACGPAPLERLPGALAGRWVSLDPRYDGRVLELKPESIAIHLGGNLLDRYPIASVEMTPEEESIAYVVNTASGDVEQMVLHVRHGPDASLWVGNRQEVLWIREAR